MSFTVNKEFINLDLLIPSIKIPENVFLYTLKVVHENIHITLITKVTKSQSDHTYTHVRTA